MTPDQPTQRTSGHGAPTTTPTLADADLTILVPTRNESANVHEFVGRVSAALDGANFAWRFLFRILLNSRRLSFVATVYQPAIPGLS